MKRIGIKIYQNDHVYLEQNGLLIKNKNIEHQLCGSIASHYDYQKNILLITHIHVSDLVWIHSILLTNSEVICNKIT